MDIFHSDVCGPLSSNSLSGYVYYVSFIDDFSHKTWIYLLKGKNEVFNKFNEFKALVKNHTERNIKTLWSDNNGEFTSEEFKELWREYRIKRELSTPYCCCICKFRIYYDVYYYCILLYPHSIFVFLLLVCHYCIW